MMKKLVFLGIVSCLIGPLSAQVIWHADQNQSSNVNDFFRRFDSGNYPTDYCYSPGDEAGVTPSKVTTPNDPVYGKVWKVNKPQNRKRGEFARAEGDVDYYAPSEGDDIYIGWRWKIDTENGATINSECTVWQWKSAGAHDQNYPLNMEYDGDLTLNAWGPDYNSSVSQAAMRTVLWRKAIPQDTWVTFVVRIKVDKDDFGGLVQFWYNGVQQTLTNSDFNLYQVNLSADKKTAYHRTNDGSEVYPKWGIYNKKSCSYNASAYFDEMKIGSSLNSVMPSGSVTNQLPSVTITSPSNGQVFELGETIDLQANASDPDGNVEKVNFKLDGGFYKTTFSPYQTTFTPTETGTYVIGARAFDDDGDYKEESVTITVVEFDCNGDPDGTAAEDNCGVCSGGNTGVPVNACSNCDATWATSEDGTNVAGNTLDNNLNTRWSAFGKGEYIDFCLGDTLFVESVSIAFYKGNERTTTFDLLYSLDGINYTTALSNQVSSGTTLGAEIFEFSPIDAWKLRIVGRGNSINDWNSLTEVSWKEATITSVETVKLNAELTVLPNPSESGLFQLSQLIDFKVFDVHGHLILEQNADQINLSEAPKGMYFLIIQSEVIKLIR